MGRSACYKGMREFRSLEAIMKLGVAVYISNCHWHVARWDEETKSLVWVPESKRTVSNKMGSKD